MLRASEQCTQLVMNGLQCSSTYLETAQQLQLKRQQFIQGLESTEKANYIGVEDLVLDNITLFNLCELLIAPAYRQYALRAFKPIKLKPLNADNTALDYYPFGLLRRCDSIHGYTGPQLVPYAGNQRVRLYAERVPTLLQKLDALPNYLEADFSFILQKSAIQSGSLSLIDYEHQGWNYPPEYVLDQVWQWAEDEWQLLWQSHLSHKPKTTALLEQSIRHLATIHWLLTCSKPYRRGNAAIMHVLVKSLATVCGIHMLPLRSPNTHRVDNPFSDLEAFIQAHGVGADLEAFVTPLPDYCARYQYFFQEDLIWV